jgi:hypothetical protein
MLLRTTKTSLSHHPAFSNEPLGREQCQNLLTAIADLGPDWSVELHRDELGNTAIVIQSEDLDDGAFPSLVVRSSDSAFHLEELRGDEYHKLGDYRVWADALRAVRFRMILEMPVSTMLH